MNSGGQKVDELHAEVAEELFVHAPDAKFTVEEVEELKMYKIVGNRISA